MCTGSCSKFIAVPLYIFALVSIICNIVLFFPDLSTWEEAQITQEVKYMGGFLGGGIMVLIPAIHIHLTSADKCCANRCGMFLSIGFAGLGVCGAIYSMSAAALGLIHGPMCFWTNPETMESSWGTPFFNNYTITESYLTNPDQWELCQIPKNVVEFNVALFSTLLVAASLELILCLIQMINGLFGCLCGTCSSSK